MKTIKQIADELGVSKTAVRKKITETIRNQFAETIGNTIYINETGVSLIKSTFNTPNGNQNANQVSGNQTETVSDSLHQVSDQVSDSEQVNKLIDMLQKELEIKNKQIEELTATVKLQAESINSAHKNELAETIIDGQKALIGNNPEGKQGFFKRLFKNK